LHWSAALIRRWDVSEIEIEAEELMQLIEDCTDKVGL
jgi:hypothetical protein